MRSTKLLSSVLFWLPTVLFIAAWEAGSRLLTSVPSAGKVAIALLDLLREKAVYAGIGQTLGRSIASFAVAALVGIFFGAAIGAGGRFGDGFSALIDFLRSVPAPALLPVFMSLLGLYSGPKLMLAIFVCALVNIVYVSYGIRRESRSLRAEMGRLFGAGRWFLFIHVVLPGAIESIIAGLRVTLSLALVLSTLAELVLMTGGGAGVMIRISYEDREEARMFALILMIGVVGYLLNRLFTVLESNITRIYAPTRRFGATLV